MLAVQSYYSPRTLAGDEPTRLKGLAGLLLFVLLILVVLAGILLVSTSSHHYYVEPAGAGQGGAAAHEVHGVACYYLTNISGERLLAARCSMAIVDPDETPVEVVKALRKRGVVVLAYLNAGYAENWRSYWGKIAGKPWVHGLTEYEGEFFVEFWRPEWREIIGQLAVTYVEKGYSGVFLDNIDAAEIVAEKNLPWASGVNTTKAMIELVCNVSTRLKVVNASSLTFINIGGAPSMLYSRVLLDCIDGVLREELWHTVADGKLVPQDPEEVAQTLKALMYARLHGKIVIVVDPVDSKLSAMEFCRRAWSYGFIPVPQPIWALDYSQPPPPNWCQPP